MAPDAPYLRDHPLSDVPTVGGYDTVFQQPAREPGNGAELAALLVLFFTIWKQGKFGVTLAPSLSYRPKNDRIPRALEETWS